MWNNTKQNVVASFDYECLIWGTEETWEWGGGRTGRIYEGSTTELKVYSEGQKEPPNGAESLNAHSTWHMVLG